MRMIASAGAVKRQRLCNRTVAKIITTAITSNCNDHMTPSILVSSRSILRTTLAAE